MCDLIDNDLFNWNRNHIVGEPVPTNVLTSRQGKIIDEYHNFIHDDDLDMCSS